MKMDRLFLGLSFLALQLSLTISAEVPFDHKSTQIFELDQIKEGVTPASLNEKFDQLAGQFEHLLDSKVHEGAIRRSVDKLKRLELIEDCLKRLTSNKGSDKKPLTIRSVIFNSFSQAISMINSGASTCVLATADWAGKYAVIVLLAATCAEIIAPGAGSLIVSTSAYVLKVFLTGGFAAASGLLSGLLAPSMTEVGSYTLYGFLSDCVTFPFTAYGIYGVAIAAWHALESVLGQALMAAVVI